MTGEYGRIQYGLAYFIAMFAWAYPAILAVGGFALMIALALKFAGYEALSKQAIIWVQLVGLAVVFYLAYRDVGEAANR